MQIVLLILHFVFSSHFGKFGVLFKDYENIFSKCAHNAKTFTVITVFVVSETKLFQLDTSVTDFQLQALSIFPNHN